MELQASLASPECPDPPQTLPQNRMLVWVRDDHRICVAFPHAEWDLSETCMERVQSAEQTAIVIVALFEGTVDGDEHRARPLPAGNQPKRLSLRETRLQHSQLNFADLIGGSTRLPGLGFQIEDRIRGAWIHIARLADRSGI